VYDITDRHSFSSIKQEWIGQVKSYTSPEVVLLLVGAKLDLDDKREVTTDEGVELAK
jgi:GTPase SAR1 family protein